MKIMKVHQSILSSYLIISLFSIFFHKTTAQNEGKFSHTESLLIIMFDYHLRRLIRF